MAGVPKGKLFPLHGRITPYGGCRIEYIIDRGIIWSVFHHYQNKATAERNRDHNNIQAQKHMAREKRAKKKYGASYDDRGYATHRSRWAVFPTVMGWSLCQLIEKVGSKHGKQYMASEPWS